VNNVILEMRNITKTFPGVRALHNVNFKVKEGEIHCLVGENGAGKTTLMKILSGIHPYGDYSGDILINGEIQRFSSIRDSEKKGIAIISQELALIPELSIYENIYFGHEIMRGRVIDRNQTIINASEVLKRVKLDVNPTIKVGELRVGNQQLVEIAKILSKNAKIVILDEPTSSLNETESENLLNLLRELKEEGVTLIMISHRLREVVSIADTITVLRDGETICSMDATEKSVDEFDIITHMVGRELENIYPKRKKIDFGDKLFEIKNWTAFDPKKGRVVLDDINLHVRKGEVVGIAGLMGAGRTELALSIFGNTPGYRLVSGEVYLNGENTDIRSPMDALKQGIAYVTEDRKQDGLILIQDIKYNITISNLESLLYGKVIHAINENEEIVAANRYKDAIDIKAPSIMQKVLYLSGGNQQKVSMAKVLFTNPKLLMLDEPTRGIDVGAKYEIYTLINEMVATGMSIIMISSELSELIGLCDRIYVMSEGKITGCINKEEFSEQVIMELATNIQEEQIREPLN
jgi:putative multiple sugar transport system ATP-binding protein